MEGTRCLPSVYGLLSCFAVFLFVGCASVETHTSPVSLGGERLVKPERVLIYDFAVSPEQVQLDEGIIRSVSETVRGTEGTPRTQKELELGRRVSRSLTENLVKELGKYGIPAERASGPPPTKSNVHFVKGDFVSIDEGSMTQRMVIGFGMGRSVVRAEGRVYQMTAQGPRLVGLFDSEVKSGRKPGMGPMVGVGAATGNIVASAAISRRYRGGIRIYRCVALFGRPRSQRTKNGQGPCQESRTRLGEKRMAPIGRARLSDTSAGFLFIAHSTIWTRMVKNL